MTTDRFLRLFYMQKNVPSKLSVFLRGGSGRDSLCPAESTPKRRVDRFNRFSTTHGCVQQTDRHTDHATSVATGRISLHSAHAMCNSKRCSFLQISFFINVVLIVSCGWEKSFICRNDKNTRLAEQNNINSQQRPSYSSPSTPHTPTTTSACNMQYKGLGTKPSARILSVGNQRRIGIRF